jgi:hypothetical protein
LMFVSALTIMWAEEFRYDFSPYLYFTIVSGSIANI